MKEIELFETVPGEFAPEKPVKRDRFGAFCFHACMFFGALTLTYAIDALIGR